MTVETSCPPSDGVVQADHECDALILTQLGIDADFQDPAEQAEILLLLFRRGDAPETAQHETGDPIHVHPLIDDGLELLGLVSRGGVAVDDLDQCLAGLADEVRRLLGCLGRGRPHQNGDGTKDQGKNKDKPA